MPPRAGVGRWSHKESCARAQPLSPPTPGRGGAALAGCARSFPCDGSWPRSPNSIYPRAPEEPLSGPRPGSSCTTEPPGPGASDPGAQEVGGKLASVPFLIPCSSSPDFQKSPSAPPHPVLLTLPLPQPLLPGPVSGSAAPGCFGLGCPYFPTAAPPSPTVSRSFPSGSRSHQAFSLGFLSRTESGLNRSSRGAFRSPRPSPKSGPAEGTSEEPLHLEIQKLKEKKKMLDKEISQLISGGYSEDEMEEHISLLHEYNDIKDVGQMLLGKLAMMRGVTSKELYPEFGLDVND